MSEISDLYQPLILEHSRSPRNYHEPESLLQTVEAYNPLCGDQFKIYFNAEQAKLTDLSFSGYGCAVSKAATSVLLLKLEGLSLAEAVGLLQKFKQAIEGNAVLDDKELMVFQVAKKYPGRTQCALLSAEAMIDFLIKK